MQNASNTIEESVDVNASMNEISQMSAVQAQVIIQRLKAERNILSTLSKCLLSLHFKELSDQQKRSLTHLIRVQAGMVGIEVPGDE